LDAFSWVGQIFEAMFQFIPRLVIVRDTHGAVKWTMQGVKEVKGGTRTWYWPATTEIELLVTARQTLNLYPQSLETRDGKQISVSGFLVYSIEDVVKAIGQRNWDVETTIADISGGTICSLVLSYDYEDLLAAISSGKFSEELTQACQERLSEFGVNVQEAGFMAFTSCRALNLLGTPVRVTNHSGE